MILGTAWYGFRYFTAANYFATAASLGLTAVEVPLYWQMVEDRLFPVTRTEHIRQLAADAGVKLHAGVAALELSTPFGIRGSPITQDEIDFNIVLGRRIIDVAVLLGLEVVRLVEPNIYPKHQALAPEFLENYGKRLGEFATYAERSGLRVVAENYGITSAQMRLLLDAADHPNVGTNFDPCNYFRIGEDPVEALARISDKVFYCHIKDAVRDERRAPDALFPGSRWRPSVAVGAGDIDWAALIPALAKTYAGVAAFECEDSDEVVMTTTKSRDLWRAIAASQPDGQPIGQPEAT